MHPKTYGFPTHKTPRQLNLVLFDEDERLLVKLRARCGLNKSAVLRHALRKLAQQEGIDA